jgi:glucose-1-phosphate cytidylyltransferase
MKAVILAGGFGTRLSEETYIKPKPMVEIGERPILWHIMKIYSAYGINDFIICCGYKGYFIKEYFANYTLHQADVKYELKDSKITILKNNTEAWSVTLVDTGYESKTGGRLKRVKEYVKDQKTFCFTYGDGLSDVNIKDLIRFHQHHGKIATLTTVMPPGRFGNLKLGSKNSVTDFKEKPEGDGGWINGGFFVLNSKIFDYLQNDQTSFEEKTLVDLSHNNQLSAFKHKGFWQAMDTNRDKVKLNENWNKGLAKWKIWK